MKECPICGEIKMLSAFNDVTLVSGVGRICNECKLAKSSGRSEKGAWGYEYLDTKTTSKTLKPTSSQLNRFENFILEPEKYATGTEKSRQKVEELELFVSQFESTLNQKHVDDFDQAKTYYENALAEYENERGIKKEDRVAELSKACKERLAVHMTYKGLNRTIYPYAVNETYCVGYCTQKRDLRTFRIDRMQKVKIGEPFIFVAHLAKDAQSRVVSAPSYSYSRRGYRRY